MENQEVTIIKRNASSAMSRAEDIVIENEKDL